MSIHRCIARCDSSYVHGHTLSRVHQGGAPRHNARFAATQCGFTRRTAVMMRDLTSHARDLRMHRRCGAPLMVVWCWCDSIAFIVSVATMLRRRAYHSTRASTPRARRLDARASTQRRGRAVGACPRARRRLGASRIARACNARYRAGPPIVARRVQG